MAEHIETSVIEHKDVIRRWIDAYNDRDEAVEAEVRALFQGLPPSNRRITFSALEFNRFVDGKVKKLVRRGDR